MHECVRCHMGSPIKGFCPSCYWEIYGFDPHRDKIEYININDIKIKQEHLEFAKREKIYSNTIKESVQIRGQEICPLIVDGNNNLLIGHHRYNVYKELGWTDIAILRIRDYIDLSMFMEGEGANIFIVKVDGKLVGSINNYQKLMDYIIGWTNRTPYWQESSLIVECYINLGMDKRYVND